MWSLCIEPEQVFHQDDIELLRLQEFMSMEIHELLLDGSVEPLTVCIHLRCLWVGVVMDQMEFLQAFSKVLLELRTVVREHELKGNREHKAAELEEFLGSFRCVRRCAPGKGKAAVNILESNDVPPAPVDESLNGIQSDAVTGMGGFEILRFPQHLLPIRPFHLPEMTDLLWEDPESPEIVDETADRGSGGDG